MGFEVKISRIGQVPLSAHRVEQAPYLVRRRPAHPATRAETPLSEAVSDLTRMAAIVCDAPIAFVDIFDEERYLELTDLACLAACSGVTQNGSPAGRFRKPKPQFDLGDSDHVRLCAGTTLTPHTAFFSLPIYDADRGVLGALGIVNPDICGGNLDTNQVEAIHALVRQFEAYLMFVRTVGRRGNKEADLTSEIARLRLFAELDSLTGLRNRRAFLKHLDELADSLDESLDCAAIARIDIDHFKQLNDVHGHDVGDEILRVCASRLREITGPGDIIARIGGDEFAILFTSVENIAALETKIAALRHNLAGPFDFAGREHDCRASIGIAVFPNHASGLELLMKHADLALSEAKLAGRNCTRTFRPRYAAAFRREAKMLTLARNALRANLVEPFYQPKWDLNTGKIVGFEALLRWRRSELGRFETPAKIASALDDRELSAAITEAMLERILADLRTWEDSGLEIGHVGINTSASDFANDSFAERLISKLLAAGTKLSHIEVEVTESVVLSGSGRHVQRAIAAIREAGARVALDDFGTGYASLTNLKNLPISALKIDRSFVSDIVGNSGDRAIIGMIAKLGEALGIEIVAEGIENRNQEAALRGMGIGIGQGYLFSPAVPASQVPGLVAGRPDRPPRTDFSTFLD